MTNLAQHGGSRRALVADGVAGVLVWFDFGVIGMIAPWIGGAIVASGSVQTDVLVILAIFALGFLLRPVGAFAFRRAHRALPIVLMATATTLMALLPDRSTAGLVSGVLLVALRIVQGLAAGAETRGAIWQRAATAEPRHRASMAAWSMTVNLSGYTVGALVALIILLVAGKGAMADGAWRWACAIALPLAVVVLLLRRAYPAPSAQAPQPSAAPTAARQKGRAPVVLVLLAVIAYNAMTGGLQVGTPWLGVSDVGWDPVGALAVAFVFGLVPLSFPVTARLVGRIGARRLLAAGAAAALILSAPTIALLSHPSPAPVLGVLAGAVPMSLLGGAIQGFLQESFASSPRTQLVYSLSAAVFGGTSPLIMNALAYGADTRVAGSGYLIATAAVSLLALLAIRLAERKQHATHGAA